MRRRVRLWIQDLLGACVTCQSKKYIKIYQLMQKKGRDVKDTMSRVRPQLTWLKLSSVYSAM